MKKITVALLEVLCLAFLLLPGTALADAAVGGEYNLQYVDYDVQVDAPDGYVNFRYGPGMEYGVRYPIYNGEILHIYQTADNYYDGLSWGQTNYYGDYGWVSLSQTSYIEPYTTTLDPYSAETYGVSYYVRVDAPDGYVNFRSGPGLAYEIQFPIWNGETLYIAMEGYNYSDGLTWGRTEYSGRTGWVSLSQTTRVEAEPVPEPTTTVPVTEPEPTTAEPIAESETKIAPDADIPNQSMGDTGYLVSDAFYVTGTAGGAARVFAIPQINLNGSEIQKLNTSLYNTIYPMIRDSIREVSQGEGLLESSYIWHVNGDLLSLVIYEAYIGPWHEYQVYNISISDAQVLDNREFLSRTGWAESQYTQMAENALEESFARANQDRLAAATDTAAQADYSKLHDTTVSMDTIAAAMPYMNGQGDLHIIGQVYLFRVQNPFSWTDLSLDGSSAGNGFNATVSWAQNSLEMHSGPGSSSQTLATIYAGQKLYIVGTQYNDDDGMTWGKTSYNGLSGWVPMDQVQE